MSLVPSAAHGLTLQIVGQLLGGLGEEKGVAREQVASVGMGFPGPVDDRRGVR